MGITKRDQLLLLKLQNYSMLTTNQVRELVFGNIDITTVLRRLRVLEGEKLIARVKGLESTENLWVLTENGADIGNLKLWKRNFPKGLLEHDHKLVTLRLAFETIGIAKSWIPEHEIRSKVCQRHGIRSMKDRLIPDALMGAEINGRSHTIAVELELNLKNKRRYEKIFDQYSSKPGVEIIWYVIRHKSQMGILLKYWKRYVYLMNGKKIYFSILEDVLQNLENSILYSQSPRKLSEVFKIDVTPIDAQGVSSSIEDKIELQKRPTTENFAPILENTG